MSEMATEWGRSLSTVSLYAYRSGAGIVGSPDSAPSVPSGTPISISNFYSAYHGYEQTKYATTYVDGSSLGYSSPTQALTNDGLFASCSVDHTNTDIGTFDWETFGFDSAIPSGATIVSVTLNIRNYHTGSGTITEKVAVYSGVTTKLAPTVVTHTSATVSTFSVSGMSRSDLLNANLKVEYTCVATSTGASGTCYLDYANLDVVWHL